MADSPPRGRRWITWALVASLGLNLVGIGIIGGALIKGPPPEPMPALWRYARDLPEPYSRDLGRALRDSRRDWTGPREALRGQQRALAATLTAEPFDPAAVEAVLSRQTEVVSELSTRGSGMLMAQIVRMSPDERAAYASALLTDRGAKHGRRR